MSTLAAPAEHLGVDNQNPWLGLTPFTEEFSCYFFGRADETAELFRLLKRERLTVLFGQSGLGKTSMLQAGLFPRLRQADFLPVYTRLLHDKDAPNLAAQVKVTLSQTIETSKVDAPNPDASETLWEYFHRKDVDFWSAKQRLMTPVLVFDQFEEIFTLGRTDDVRRSQSQAFLTELADLIEGRAPAAVKDKLNRTAGEADRFIYDQERCKVILSLREDYLAALEGLRPLIRSISQNRMRILPMNGLQALQAVAEPGEMLLEEGVATRIVQFVAGSNRNGELRVPSCCDEPLSELQVEPALLSVVCRELNAERQRLHLPKITPDLLASSRSEIIAGFYERSLGDLPRAARLFVENRLLTKSGYRAGVALDTATAECGVARETIDRLVNRRLLRLEDRFGVQQVELTHDVLTEVVRASRDSRQRIERFRKKLVALSVGVVILLAAGGFGKYLYGEYLKRCGDWTSEFNVDFSQAPPKGPERTRWLEENFVFQNGEMNKRVNPWQVDNGAMLMEPHGWCWLNKVRIRDDTRVVVDLQFGPKPEALQICINAKPRLRNPGDNPPGYSCRYGIWDGSMDLITGNEDERRNEFNSLLLNSTLQAGGAVPRDIKLTFQRQGETVSLQVNGKEVHHETYLKPLFGKHQSAGELAENYENIGLRTWGSKVQILGVHAYRFKPPVAALPTVAGDALVEAGHVDEAIEKYKTIAKDYENVSISVPALALTRAYLLAVQREDAKSRRSCYGQLAKAAQFDWSHPFQSAKRAEYFETVREVETFSKWKDGGYGEALKDFPAIFKVHPGSRVVMECLQTEHRHLGGAESQQLLKWIVKTFTHSPELAGLDVSSFDLTDLTALAPVHSLRGLDCRNNQLTKLDPLRSMGQLRALYCGQNDIGSLEPIRNLNLIELYCSRNRIESLDPLSRMPLVTLYCDRNQIKDLSPLKQRPIYALDCSYNQINSLDAVSDLPTLGELYCSSNSISSLEPLRHAKSLQYLDCSANTIQTLEPLRNLELQSLNCSGNRLETLEPFVNEGIPPATFVFDCGTLPDAEIERAIRSWSSKDLRFHVNYGKLLLLLRHNEFDKVRSLASEFAGRGYLFVQSPMMAREADQFCARLGGHLVTIQSEAENEFLTRITPLDASCRIGLVVSKGEPRWVTGKEVKEFVPPSSDFRPSDGIVTWKNGSWLPIPSREDKPLPFIIEWDSLSSSRTISIE